MILPIDIYEFKAMLGLTWVALAHEMQVSIVTINKYRKKNVDLLTTKHCRKVLEILTRENKFFKAPVYQLDGEELANNVELQELLLKLSGPEWSDLKLVKQLGVQTCIVNLMWRFHEDQLQIKDVNFDTYVKKAIL